MPHPHVQFAFPRHQLHKQACTRGVRCTREQGNAVLHGCRYATVQRVHINYSLYSILKVRDLWGKAVCKCVHTPLCALMPTFTEINSAPAPCLLTSLEAYFELSFKLYVAVIDVATSMHAFYGIVG